MLEPTKKLHTKNCTILQFFGPSLNKDKAIETMRSLGFQESNDVITSRNLFPQYTDKELPGATLRGARYKEGLTQQDLAELTEIPQRHISEMENGKRSIGKKNAGILAKALNAAGYKVFL